MKKVVEYVASFLVENGISRAFSVTGGGAMHLNDALGHKEGLKCIYNHHEQACAIAAEAYARIHNKIAVLCVTTGPGGINALTGVAGGYLDSIPMLVLSGQVRFDTTARSTGLGIRALGDQEFDITKAVESMTKYCEMVIDPMKIRYCLEKALYIAKSGRPGPCWLDIPLNVQGAYIDETELVGFDAEEYEKELFVQQENDRALAEAEGRACVQASLRPEPVSESVVREVLERIKSAARPVIYAGNGIRIAGAFEVFRRVADKLGIAVVTGWNSIDIMEDENSLYVGRGGIMGDRAGNFAVQNSDLVVAIGSRLSIRQVGYNYKTWAREAYVVMVDADSEELKKPTLHVDMPIHADALDFLLKMDELLTEKLPEKSEWMEQCREWKANYPVVMQKHYEDTDKVNVYAFIGKLSSMLKEKQITVVGNGSACVVGSHAYVIKKGQRFIINSAIASMGYDLPAAIGACFAQQDGESAFEQAGDGFTTEPAIYDREIILVTGDGSIQMNLQELQTIIHHKLPIKIFLINNGGYHSIRQTQKNFFGEPLVGIGDDSYDLSFPSMEKLSYAYGYPYYKVEENDKLIEVIGEVLSVEGPLVCEVFVNITQNFEPKSATKRLEDGTLVSAPLEDLAPFLPKEELKANMLIPLVEEN
ncbi:MAG: thiamine pyrophosphate-binding protein [Lachnospiraceae bacterium]|nr:thiamine pyrophosphate-binding protein [Lachnospiraceae bacterium]